MQAANAEISGERARIAVKLQATKKGSFVAKCSLVNDKGTWYATTPGSVTVRRSYKDLTVNCASDGLDPGISTVKSSTKPMAFGNILFGGVIGVGVDAATGAAYDYPEVITVHMGQVIGASTSAAQATAAEKTAGDEQAAKRLPPPTAATPPVAPTPAPATEPKKETSTQPAALATVAVVPPPTVAAASPVAALQPAVYVPTSSATPPAVAFKAEPAAPVGAKESPLSGQDGYRVQRLAQDEACRSSPVAVLTAEGAGFESYTVSCSNGDALAYRCEFGNCKVLK